MEETSSDRSSANGLPRGRSVAWIFLRFLRFGLVAWGGPTAQIAMLRHELVERERWVDDGRFRRALAVYQVLPGPEAHELCCWFGMLARGRAGAVAAGLGFMLPGFVLMLGASWAYLAFGTDGTRTTGAFLAAQAAVVALVLRATTRLGRSMARGPLHATIALLAAAAQLMHVPFWVPLAAGGAIAAAVGAGRRTLAAVAALAFTALAVAIMGDPSSMSHAAQASAGGVQAAPSPFALLGTGLVGGLVSFGGAYTAIPAVREIATGAHGWMSDAQFLDGLAIGGVLPSPLVIFGTFVGFLGAGWLGALAVTAGIFAPAFGFTLVGHELMERIVEERRLHAMLDGVAAAVIGLVAATAVVLLADTCGIAVHDPSGSLAPSIARPGLLAVVGAAWIALSVLRSAWAVPIVLGAAAAVGAALM